MELENFTFYLFDRVFKNGFVNTLIISIHPNTGETIILSKSADGSSDYRPMKKEQIDLNEENSNSYLTVIRMLNEYLKDYNPELMINSKVDLRINHLRKVIGYYYDWFKSNNNELPELPPYPDTALSERSIIVNEERVHLNERQYKIISVLRNSSNPLKTIEILDTVDALCGTITSYTRVSEIFKGKRDVFNACIEKPRKGFYKLKDNF